MKARYPGYCSRCDQPISVGDDVVLKRGRVPGLIQRLHARCASGQDDE